ncbi:hypothetical protein evm_008535 [Chilo suppressalis]|nr:hypothetical protein evm_008535 [Chilo suppressalis]
MGRRSDSQIETLISRHRGLSLPYLPPRCVPHSLQPKLAALGPVPCTRLSFSGQRTALRHRDHSMRHTQAGKEGCYIKEVNDVVPFGTVLRPLGYCYRISCGPKVISYASCGKIINHNPRCFVSKTDVTKPHPDCCPHLICEDTNNNV